MALKELPPTITVELGRRLLVPTARLLDCSGVRRQMAGVRVSEPA